MRSKILSLSVSIIIFLVSLEVIFGVVSRLGFIHRDLPTYSLRQARQRFWTEINPVFGVWHPKNTQFRHHRSCFDVTYTSNSFGMRDKERSLKPDIPRTLMIGDSLIEGWGVADEYRISNQLEKLRNKPHLNFGVAGYFGPNQYFLLYRDFAKRFDHDEVIVGIFPNNDFTDDDYDYWRATGRWKGWYKPFLIGKYPNYHTIYTEEKPKGKELPVGRYLVRVLREFSYTYGALAYLNKLYRETHDVIMNTPPGEAFAGYYDFTQKAFDRMRFSLERLLKEASGKRVSFIIIPEAQDILRYKKMNNQEAPLSRKFREWGKQNRVQIFDLLPYFANSKISWEKLYLLPCDMHLSNLGNRLAAQYIFENIKEPHQASLK